MNAEQTAGWAHNFKLIVERAGAEFVGIENDGSVLFRADAESPTCSLYPAAIRSTQDILLALKSAAEAKKAAMWELSHPAAFR